LYEKNDFRRNDKKEKTRNNLTLMRHVLMAKIEDAVAETLKTFFTQVEREYNLPKDALWRKWKEEDKPTGNGITSHVVAPKKEPINKKSDYQTFFSIQRNKMVKENPNITFGEISKQVSHMWKKLTREEKVQYTANHTTPITEKTSLEDLRKEYMKISTADLKNLCKEKGIVAKFRKKDDIVDALVSWEEKKSPCLVFSPEETITKGRSKLELSAEDKDDEEEDFYFHDDGSSTSNESRACDEDDTGILISDDDDIFGDDD
jgi:hypothetical protein